MADDDVPPFIPPAPVKPGFDRIERAVTITPAESWGYVGRPSRMKQPLPEGWRPARLLTPREEERLVDMKLWAKANAVEKADWNAYLEYWLRNPIGNRGENRNGRSLLGTIERVAEELDRRQKADGAGGQDLRQLPKGFVP